MRYAFLISASSALRETPSSCGHTNARKKRKSGNQEIKKPRRGRVETGVKCKVGRGGAEGGGGRGDDDDGEEAIQGFAVGFLNLRLVRAPRDAQKLRTSAINTPKKEKKKGLETSVNKYSLRS